MPDHPGHRDGGVLTRWDAKRLRDKGVGHASPPSTGGVAVTCGCRAVRRWLIAASKVGTTCPSCGHPYREETAAG